MPTTVHAYAAASVAAELKPFEYTLPDPGPKDVDLRVKACGICHSDLSVLNNEWGISQFPFVPGHEIVGEVAAVGELVTTVKVGDTVGVGWFSRSCMTCSHCMSGDHNLCASAEGIMIGRHGGFADTVRADEGWCNVLPKGVNPSDAGPLFCGGITVFNPIVQLGIKPTDRVGVIGIGGLGHMALMFLDKWGCHVTAFSTSENKRQEAMELGADAFVNTKDEAQVKAIQNALDVIICTVNVRLDWDMYVAMLRPRGRLHAVGAITDTFGVSSNCPMLMGQKSLSSSPLGSPATTAMMLDFCARHDIQPVTEHFPLASVNDAMEKLRSGSPRYRLVLDVS